jgi:hypothetical protein
MNEMDEKFLEIKEAYYSSAETEGLGINLLHLTNAQLDYVAR